MVGRYAIPDSKVVLEADAEFCRWGTSPIIWGIRAEYWQDLNWSIIVVLWE